MMCDDHNTHTIEVVLRGNYPVGEEEQVRLKVSGDGSVEYFVDTMKAFLIAAGFAPKTVEKIGFIDDPFEE
jgi:hypothetical protein